MSFCTQHDVTTDSSMAAEGVGCHYIVRRLLPLGYSLAELGFAQADSFRHLHGQ